MIILQKNKPLPTNVTPLMADCNYKKSRRLNVKSSAIENRKLKLLLH